MPVAEQSTCCTKDFVQCCLGKDGEEQASYASGESLSMSWKAMIAQWKPRERHSCWE